MAGMLDYSFVLAWHVELTDFLKTIPSTELAAPGVKERSALALPSPFHCNRSSIASHTYCADCPRSENDTIKSHHDCIALLWWLVSPYSDLIGVRQLQLESGCGFFNPLLFTIHL